MDLVSINPSTDTELHRYAEWSPDEVDAVLAAADAAQRRWERSPLGERCAALGRAAEGLEARRDELARLMAMEMGKPRAHGRAEVDKCSRVCRYYAEHGGAFLAPRPVDTGASRTFVAFRPLGVVLAIMPWNFPLWQVFRFAAPGLLAGNGGLLKHANTVTGCALAIEEILRDAGFPADLFRTLVVDIPAMERIIRHPVVKAVSLTGSTRAGREVARTAGSALKKTVLELGGSDPYLVLADADLDLAAERCVASRLINGGQSCIAAKRFIVVEPNVEPFTERVVELMRSRAWGDPLEGDVDLGPMARRDLRDELHRQVTASVEAGAHLLLGGEVPDREGYFYPPTVLGSVPESAPAAREETFGPVAAVLSARDEAHAVRLANDSPFGLGAAVFTRDSARGERLAVEEIRAGTCVVNDLVRSDPRLPFGGILDSGYGRELSEFGLHEFVNVKTISLA